MIKGVAVVLYNFLKSLLGFKKNLFASFVKISVVLILLVGSKITAFSQEYSNVQDFDFLVAKVKAVYPGYRDKVTPQTRPQLEMLEKELRRKIAAYPDSCKFYMQQYVRWFKDFHLSVRNVSNNNQVKEKSAPNHRYITVNIDSLRQQTQSGQTIEGVWRIFDYQIAIVKDRQENKFYGIALKYRNAAPNQLVFIFEPTGIADFELTFFPSYYNYAPTKSKASLEFDNKILELHNDTRFVRATNSKEFDNALWETYQPKYPNGRNIFQFTTYLNDSTFYLRASSFGDSTVEKLVDKHWKEITSRPNLIIDLRSNDGGSDIYYQSLLKLVYTNPYFTKGVEWYACSDNIKLFEDAIKNKEINGGDEGIKATKALLEAMHKNVGGFVLHPMMGHDRAVTRDTIYTYPKRVGIIIEETNGSSAEQFILSAKNSKKVILFGDKNTAGVLDYSNAVQIVFPSGNYSLRYPMTRSRRLPENPIDNKGIAPDVRIPFPNTKQIYSRIDDWVYFVKSYLEAVR